MRAHLAKMSLLFEEADTSGDGRLDLEELSKSMSLMSHCRMGVEYFILHEWLRFMANLGKCSIHLEHLGVVLGFFIGYTCGKKHIIATSHARFPPKMWLRIREIPGKKTAKYLAW